MVSKTTPRPLQYAFCLIPEMIPPWFITQNRHAFGDISSARDVRSGTGSLPNKTDVFLGMHACFTSRQIDKKGSLTVADWYRTFWYWYNRSGFLGHAACDVRIINDNAQSVHYWTNNDSREHQNCREVLRVWKEMQFRVAVNRTDTLSMVHLLQR